jgi:hypothetical protein
MFMPSSSASSLPSTPIASFIQGDFLLTDTLVEAGHLGGAVGFQVIEVQLNFLVVFVER